MMVYLCPHVQKWIAFSCVYWTLPLQKKLLEINRTICTYLDIQCPSYLIGFSIISNNFLPRFRITVIFSASETYVQRDYKNM